MVLGGARADGSRAALAGGYTIVSVAGYSPDFVRHSALSAWEVPADVKVEPVGQILSALRRVGSGEQVVRAARPDSGSGASNAAFCQRPQGRCAVPGCAGRHHCRRRQSRLPAARAKAFQAGLLKMGKGPVKRIRLESLKLEGFVMPQLPAECAASREADTMELELSLLLAAACVMGRAASACGRSLTARRAPVPPAAPPRTPAVRHRSKQYVASDQGGTRIAAITSPTRKVRADLATEASNKRRLSGFRSPGRRMPVRQGACDRAGGARPSDPAVGLLSNMLQNLDAMPRAPTLTTTRRARRACGRWC